MKPLHKLQKSASVTRINEIASLIQSPCQEKPTDQQLQTIFRKFPSACANQEKVHKKTARSTREEQISPLQDLKACYDRMTWYLRCQLKSSLIKIGKDIFAPNHQVYALIREFSQAVEVEENNGVFYVKNIKEVLELHLTRLAANHKLRNDHRLKNKIFLCLSGDKGGKSTKCCIAIGNVDEPNSVHNLFLVGIYNGDDKASSLRNSFANNVFKQVMELKHLNYRLGNDTVTKEVQMHGFYYTVLPFLLWFLRFITGDMIFLCAIYGHLGPTATHPCLLCETPLAGYKKAALYQARSLASMNLAAEDYQVNEENRSLRPQDRTCLSRIFKSVKQKPAVEIPIDCIIPSSLHIIQGLAQDLLKLLECEAEKYDSLEALDVIYKQLGADKQAYFQIFTDNQIRKLLTSDGPERMMAVIRGSRFYDALLTLFRQLGHIQDYAKAEVNDCERLVQIYFNTFRKSFPSASITSKAHWLVIHVPQFMKQWKFWGLLSEQPIKAMHHQFNIDKTRFALMRKEELIIKKCIQQSCL